MSPVTIAVDFDKTFTADPECFRALVMIFRGSGHTVLMVTQRCEQFRNEIEAVTGKLEHLFDAVVFASGKSKEDAARQAGYTVDIWIDDSPYSVYTPLRYRGCPEPSEEKVDPMAWNKRPMEFDRT